MTAPDLGMNRGRADAGLLLGARNGDRGAVAVTLLLLLVVLGGATPSELRGPTVGGRALEVGIAVQELAATVLDSGREPTVRPIPTVAPAGSAVWTPPRFRRVDGHAWPPPRAPTG